MDSNNSFYALGSSDFPNKRLIFKMNPQSQQLN